MDFVTRLRPNENDSDGKLYDKVVLLDERSVMASRKKIDPKYPQVVILSPQMLSGILWWIKGVHGGGASVAPG